MLTIEQPPPIRSAIVELIELVQNQVDMHRHMSMMHDHMVSQMPHK
jgi:hypothetical protein